MTALFMLFLAEITMIPPVHDPVPIDPARQEMADAAALLSSQEDAGDVPTIQDVKIGDHTYRLPVVDHQIQYFGTRAVEVLVPSSFWCSISSTIDPKNWPEGVCGGTSGRQTIYFSIPDRLFQWRTDRPGLPPVRGPVEFWREANSVKLWRSLDPEIHTDGLLYATFNGRADIYGICNEAHLDWLHSCEIKWFDGTMIHHLSVPAKWLENAPAALDEYRRRIRPLTPPTR